MNKTLHVFPAPRTVSIRKEQVNLSGADWIILPSSCGRALRERVQENADGLGRVLNRPIRISAAVPSAGAVLLMIRTDLKAATPQAYELQLEQGACILRAGGEAGAFYGLLAFVQIVEQFGNVVPALTIKDGPDFPARGVMLDVSRCKVPTMETCRQLIDRLAVLRINQLQLYIEHTFAFAAHQSVWHDASPFTHAEILELDQYCADRFIELVPNLNSFGHFQRWLQHPEYRHLGECPDVPDCSTLAPNAASLRLIESLYDEYLPHFRSGLFNVGCDETWELGKGRSKARAAKSSTTQVYFDFLKRIHKLVQKKGRRMQFWGDIILHEPELIKELPKDILPLCWGYDADYPFNTQCRAFAEAGVEFHVCPGTSAWNSITGRTDNCLANLENAAVNGLKYGATGYLNTDWGDGGHHQVLPISYVGYTAGAGYSWNMKANREVDLAGAISRHFFDDPSGRLGQCCLDLGRTLNRIPGLKRGNCSGINQLLFSNLQKLDISGITRTQYKRAEAWLDKIEADLAGARAACPDRELVLHELRHTLAMSRYALHRGAFAQYGAGTADALRQELQGVIMRYEDQWLARNRRGGLRESSTRLRNTAESVAASSSGRT